MTIRPMPGDASGWIYSAGIAREIRILDDITRTKTVFVTHMPWAKSEDEWLIGSTAFIVYATPDVGDFLNFGCFEDGRVHPFQAALYPVTAPFVFLLDVATFPLKCVVAVVLLPFTGYQMP
ncbi:MAG: hypothetical protein JW925_13145 [Syntrophaceae bacterium]|nr:hypothetical protein [Syntrophaceae bacterium]